MYTKICLLFSFMICMYGCGEDQKIHEEIAQIPVEINAIRFDRAFAGATPRDLPALKGQYPYLFPTRYPDSVWVAKMQDSLQRELLDEVGSAFADMDSVVEDLELFYKHVLYYFPGQPVPKLVTVTSDVDYNNRIVLADTLMLIGLDNYLGSEHRFYEGIDRYIAESLDRKYLLSDVGAAFAKKVNPFPNDRSFISQMVYYGRELYLKERLLPLLSEAQIIGYSEEDLAWARANEEQIWRYFVERELLFSTDTELGPRFLDPAPFSKFRLELDNESPGRLGRYMGWQIVKAFMDRNEIGLHQLLQTPAEEVFRRSNYKPKK